MAGVDIYNKRGQLRSFQHQSSTNMEVMNPFTNTRTTEIEISSELASFPCGPRSSLSKFRMTDGPLPFPEYEQYSIRIERGPTKPQPQMSNTQITPGFPRRPANAALEANTAIKAYTKCAVLFFVSLLITWVSTYPSTPSESAQEVIILLMIFELARYQRLLIESTPMFTAVTRPSP